jgi:hypothetical protein
MASSCGAAKGQRPEKRDSALIGQAPGQARGSAAYMPITIVDIEKLRSY